MNRIDELVALLKDLFKGFDDLNKSFSFEIKDNHEHLTILCLYIQFLNKMEGAAIVASSKNVPCYYDLMRSCIEITYSINAIIESKDYATKLIFSDTCSEIQTIKNIIKFERKNKDSKDKISFLENGLRKKIAELADAASESNVEAKKLSYKDISKAGNKEDHYLTKYSFLSQSVHSNSKFVSNYLTIEDDKIKNIKYKLKPDEMFEMNLIVLICEWFELTDKLSIYFSWGDIKKSSSWEKLENRLNIMVRKNLEIESEMAMSLQKETLNY